MADIDFSITLENFNQGLSPVAHLDDKTFMGADGQASAMQADILSSPGYITQSPALADLTNGNQAGVVTELIRHILDQPTAVDTTYAIGTSKLFKLSSTAVASGGSPSWPQAVTDMTEGESVIRLKANLYGFYNKASGGDILRMPLSTEVVTANWGSATDAALQNAPHPSAAKEDILLFGNGRYVGTYVELSALLDVAKLDFGEGAEVADIIFHANNWWIAVNYGEGRRGQIYMYDGSATSNILSDEAGVGNQSIGFLYLFNGTIYVAYNDKSDEGFSLGFLNGRTITPLRYFSGTLPDHRQKTLYKNTILFLSEASIFSCGARVQQLPVQISELADGGYSTLGALAAPFGTPMVASTESTNYRLAKFSGLSLTSYWKSLFLDVSRGRNLGKLGAMIVSTKALPANAKCSITLEGDQGAVTSSAFVVETTGKTRHVFTSIDLKALEDVRVVVSYANGHASNGCPIRKIILLGSYVER